jgi:putative hydrolase of the HAD superfamily
MASTIRALILDFGEVLTRPQPRHIIERMASMTRLPVDQFLSRYWRHRNAYDSGLTGREYWCRVLEGSNGIPASLVSELIEMDALSWTDYRDAVWDIAAEFRARGNPIAMLSNGVVEIICRVRAERRLDTMFDVVIVSCEVGQCKPEPGIYRMCTDGLAVPAALTLFVDDRIENLSAAAAHDLTDGRRLQKMLDRRSCCLDSSGSWCATKTMILSHSNMPHR